MKRCLLGSIMLFALIAQGSTFAAAQNAKAKAAAAQAQAAAPSAAAAASTTNPQDTAINNLWSGFYAGVNAGLAINDSNFNLTPSGCFRNGNCGGPRTLNVLRSDSGDFNGTNLIAGVQVGFNYLLEPRFLAGLEADLDYIGSDKTHNVNRALRSPLSGRLIYSVNQRFDWLGTVRLRLGIPINCDGRTLLYVTGGYAYARVRSHSNVAFTAGIADTYAGSDSSWIDGWAIGFGGEYAFADCYSARLEYLYVDLGTHSYDPRPSNPAARSIGHAAYRTELTNRTNLIRLSFNYKF